LLPKKKIYRNNCGVLIDSSLIYFLTESSIGG